MFAPKVAKPQTADRASNPTPLFAKRHSHTRSILQEVLRSPGLPLDAQTRSYFEPRFGHDFSRVRIHSDERAAASTDALGASAYTWGSHIVLAGDHLQRDQQLLAHELAHVVQHRAQSTQAPSRISRHCSAVFLTIS